MSWKLSSRFGLSSRTPYLETWISENGRPSRFWKTVHIDPILFPRLEDESASARPKKNRNRTFWVLLKYIFFRNFIVKDMTHQYDSSIFSFKSSWFNDELMIETFLGRSSKIQFSNVNIQLEIKNSKLWFGLGFGKPIYIQWINEKLIQWNIQKWISYRFLLNSHVFILFHARPIMLY